MRYLLFILAITAPSLAMAQETVPADPWDFFFRIVYPGLGAIVTALLAWVAAELKRKVAEDRTASIFDRVTATLVGLSNRIVRETNQVFVDELKAAAADGKLTPAERKQAWERAYTKLKSFISASTFADMVRMFGGIPQAEGVIATHLEAAVADNRRVGTWAQAANKGGSRAVADPS